MRKRTLLMLPALLAACGGGSFTGTVAGNGLRVLDSAVTLTTDSRGHPNGAALVLADVGNICDTLKANRIPKNSSFVTILLSTKQGGSTVPPTVGDYTVAPLGGNGNQSIATFTKLDPNCQSVVPLVNGLAQSGLVKLSAVKLETGGTLQGSFDITFGTQKDHTSGTFLARYCDLPNGLGNLSCE